MSRFRIVAPGFQEVCYECPHSVVYWVAPDAEMQAWMRSLTWGDLGLPPEGPGDEG